MTIALPPTFYIIAEAEHGRNAAGSAVMVRESGLLCSKADVAEFPSKRMWTRTTLPSSNWPRVAGGAT